MTTQQTERPVDRLLEQGKDIVQQGNARHLVIRNADGTQIASISLTVAVVLGFASMILLPFWGMILLVAAGFFAAGKRIKVELVRELTNDDNVVQGEKS
ncbi:MAG: DUF4342 domain-containing protein [Anaerolineae bacterium]|nr:DUF4342 domain-containing protein [Anaerolineae bacterium]